MKHSDNERNREMSLESKMGRTLKIWYIIETVLILIVAVITSVVAYDVLKKRSSVVIFIIGIAYVVWLIIRTAQYRHDRIFTEIAEDIHAIRYKEESKTEREMEAQKIEDHLKRLIEENASKDIANGTPYEQEKDAENDVERFYLGLNFDDSEKWDDNQNSSGENVAHFTKMVSYDQNTIEQNTIDQNTIDQNILDRENHSNVETEHNLNTDTTCIDVETVKTIKSVGRRRRKNNQSSERQQMDALGVDTINVLQDVVDKETNTVITEPRKRRRRGNNI